MSRWLKCPNGFLTKKLRHYPVRPSLYPKEKLTLSNRRHGMLFTHSNHCSRVKLLLSKAQAGYLSLRSKSRTLRAPTSSPHLHQTQNSKLQSLWEQTIQSTTLQPHNGQRLSEKRRAVEEQIILLMWVVRLPSQSLSKRFGSVGLLVKLVRCLPGGR